MKEKILKEIFDITSKLIGYGLSVEQNYPTLKDNRIYISDVKNLAIALKNVSYEKIYNTLDNDKNFNIKMIDGGLLQFMYEFEGNDFIKHRLAFFPSPSLEEYQNETEIYKLDDIYSDILPLSVVTTPIRFDFDPANSSDVEHPASHLTIGQYKNCRIPVSSPLTPKDFVSFILRNFYNTAHKKFDIEFESSISFSATITANEEKILHLNQL